MELLEIQSACGDSSATRLFLSLTKFRILWHRILDLKTRKYKGFEVTSM